MPLSAVELGKNDFSNHSDKPSHCWVLVPSPYTSQAQPGIIYRENLQFSCLLARFMKLGPVIYSFNILPIPLNISPLNPQGQYP